MTGPEADSPKATWRSWARGLGPIGHDHGICRALIEWLPGGAVVGGYVALADEPDIADVLEHLGTVALPRTTPGGAMVWHRVRWGLDPLERSGLGTREPRPEGPPVDPMLLDVVLVPGQAFDWRGTRLGRGGGHYDRALLAAPRAARVGVSDLRRVVERLPSDDHDVAMTHLATDEGVTPLHR